MIKASQDEGSAKRSKHYNYSIVMEKVTKNRKRIEKTIDMKGRCSMGQKVLASLVIRLALAEAFTNSSRLLALDEPTTNLDREHIQKLALQLGKLIEISSNKNMQLIIISHDLDFIKLLEGYSEFYYEISKDSSNFSCISKKQIR